MRFAALALCALLGACAGTARVGVSLDSAELQDTPFFPQDADECGPAALATALGASGVAVAPGELRSRLFVPGRRGSLQPEIVATARRLDRLPYPLAPRLDVLLETVAGGTPVLVMQNLALSWWPQWHYAVVIGFDARDDTVILRSGTTHRKVMSARAFDRSWKLADRWALAVVPPESPPAAAQPREWLLAANAFEELGQPGPAARAYRAATQRWPDEVLPWQVLANLRYAQKDLAGAEQALRRAYALKPAAATLNNLAQVLLERGCPAVARRAIEKAEQLDATAPEREAIAGTRRQVESDKRSAAAADCAELR